MTEGSLDELSDFLRSLVVKNGYEQTLTTDGSDGFVLPPLYVDVHIGIQVELEVDRDVHVWLQILNPGAVHDQIERVIPTRPQPWRWYIRTPREWHTALFTIPYRFLADAEGLDEGLQVRFTFPDARSVDSSGVYQEVT